MGEGPHSVPTHTGRTPMDGLIYLLNQSGLALSQANDRIAELTEALKAATRKGEDEDGEV